MYLPHPDLTRIHQAQLQSEAEAQRLAKRARQPLPVRPTLGLARRWAPANLRRILPGAAPRIRIDPVQRAA